MLETKKPQLHVSALNMLSKCGEQFRRRYIEDEKIKPGLALIVGTATDRAATENLKHKANTKALLESQAVRDISRDTLVKTWNEGVWLNPEERTLNPLDLQGAAIDKAVRLASLHHEQLAPSLNPVLATNVQKEWVIELEGFPVDLAGAIDLVDVVSKQTRKDGTRIEAIRDLKTTKKSPTKSSAQDSEQLVMYSFAYNVLTGHMPEYAALDYMVDNKTPKVTTLTTTVTEADFEPLIRRVENATQVMDAGAFVPARADDWWCNDRWCGYHSTCKFVRRGVSAPVTIDL